MRWLLPFSGAVQRPYIFIFDSSGLFQDSLVSWAYCFILVCLKIELFFKVELHLVCYFFIVSLLACGTANISWGRVLAMRYLITFYMYSFSYICFLPLIFLYPILSTRFPCSLYQRAWDCSAWWVSPCVGVSLCVNVRLCCVSSCTWPVGDALVSRGLASGV